MDALTDGITQLGIVGILVCLILDRVIKLVSYIGNKTNSLSKKVSNNPNRIYTSEYRDLLKETLVTMNGISKAVKNSSEQTCNTLKDVSKNLQVLSREVSEMKGRIGK